MKNMCKEIKKIIPNVEILFNVNLKNYHTYHIDCFAKTLINIKNQRDLEVILMFLSKKKINYFILGNGSNVLFKNKRTKILIIRLCGNDIRLLKNNRISVFAGTSFKAVLDFCLQNNLGGLEWAANIPASVGGGVAMNMGSFNHCVSEFLEKITYFNGEKIITEKSKSNDFKYRNSKFKKNSFIVISVLFKLDFKPFIMIKNDMKNYFKIKSETQPIFEYSCGSVFKNGKDYFVAKLIQDANLKGFTIGGAEVSNLHSNFIINKNNASSKDILRLIKYIKKKIQKQYNICILCEVVIK